jgi:large subunit ribosomal protein L21
MYAVVATGGKQYRVVPGEIIQIEKVKGSVGDSVQLDRVLIVAPDEGDVIIGRPVVEGAQVTGKIIGDRRGRKIVVQKFKRRKRYLRRTGHRQHYHQVRIDSIELPS